MSLYPQLLPLLLSIIQTEQLREIRSAAARLIGVLGAIDPYRHRQCQLRIKTERKLLKPSHPEKSSAESRSSLPDIPDAPPSYVISNHHLSTSVSDATVSTPQRDTVTVTPSSEDYYPTIVINALIRILKDPTLSVHHTRVIAAFGYMFKTLHLKMVPFLPQVVPTILGLVRAESQSHEFVNFVLHEFAQIVHIVKVYVGDFVDDVFEIVRSCWNLALSTNILALFEEISLALGDGFRHYVDEASSVSSKRTYRPSANPNVSCGPSVF